MQNDLRRETQHFDRWKELKPTIRTALLLRFERGVVGELNAVTQDFVACWSSPSHDPVRPERKLHGFLVEWAKARGRQAMKKLLKIPKQTYYNWRAAASKISASEPKLRNTSDNLS